MCDHLSRSRRKTKRGALSRPPTARRLTACYQPSFPNTITGKVRSMIRRSSQKEARWM